MEGGKGEGWGGYLDAFILFDTGIYVQAFLKVIYCLFSCSLGRVVVDLMAEV